MLRNHCVDSTVFVECYCHELFICCFFFFFQAEDGIRDAQESRGLGDVYKRQGEYFRNALRYGQAELTSPRLIGKSKEAFEIKKMLSLIHI